MFVHIYLVNISQLLTFKPNTKKNKNKNKKDFRIQLSPCRINVSTITHIPINIKLLTYAGAIYPTCIHTNIPLVQLILTAKTKPYSDIFLLTTSNPKQQPNNTKIPKYQKQ